MLNFEHFPMSTTCLALPKLGVQLCEKVIEIEFKKLCCNLRVTICFHQPSDRDLAAGG